MPVFEIETPDGTFEVDAPDERAALTALGIGQQAEQPQSPELQRGLGELSAITQNPARAQYDALPGWQKPLVAASDIGQLTAQGAASMVGLNPEKLAAGLRSSLGAGSYEDELAEQQRMTTAARQRAGGAGTAAEITGAVALPMAAANRGLTLAGRFGTGAMAGKTGLAARSVLMGAEGAGYGAANAFANDQDIATGAGLGIAGGVGGNLIGEGISAGVSKIAGRFNPKTPQLGVDDLKAASNASYKKAEQAGVVFNKTGVNRLTRNIVDDLTKHGFDPANEPGVMAVYRRLKGMKDGNVTFKGLDTLRKVASNGFVPGNDSNNKVLSQIIGRIDELVDAADPATVLTGSDPKAAAAIIKEARSMWGRARKLETVEKAVTRGAQNAASQVNADTSRTTMGQLKKVLQSEAKSRGFSPAEMKQLGTASGYSTGQRALHAVSGLLPRDKLSAGIQGALTLGTGGATLPLQIAGMVAGFGAQKTSEHLARKSVAELTSLIARGGVPAPIVQNTIQLLAKSKREALSRALMAMGVFAGTHSARAEAPNQ